MTPTPSLAARLWDRELTSYPDNSRRYLYLGIVVLATISLYYQLYVVFAVATPIIVHYDMSFTFFIYVSVVANLVGAFASLLAGLGDRWGRANMVIYGLLITGLLVTFAVPNAPNKEMFMLLSAVVGFVEGIILVATPALVRDFSPQLGRATAMGYWTMGPVIGSLVVTVVTSNSFHGSTTWQDEIVYSGISGLVVFVLALALLKELSPRLRDQIMVSLRDRAVIEARAKGLDPEAALKGSWRQMLRLDIVGSAFAISVFLLLYFAAVGSAVIYFTTVFGYSVSRANAVLNWYWAANAVSLVVVGLLSDRLKVRKPFMLIGALASIVVLILFALRATEPTTGYYHFAFLVVLIGVFGGFTYAPWMAGFTETVEKHNPAATATGLAIWGWIIRIVVSVSAACLPLVVTSATPLVNHGAEVKEAVAEAGAAVPLAQAHAAVLAELSKSPTDPAVQAKAAAELGGADKLAQVVKAAPQLAILQKYGAEVQEANEKNPSQWQHWFWVCLGGEVLFVPFIFVMAGRWSPRKAREDAEAHEALMAEQLRELTT